MRALVLDNPPKEFVPYRWKSTAHSDMRFGAVFWAPDGFMWFRGAEESWPMVKGSDMPGGLYSPYAGRIIPFHKDNEWYRVFLPNYCCQRIYMDELEPARAVQL